MEEDIKILENLIKDFERIEKFNVEEKEIFSPYNKFVEIIKSIKNLIARNKELEKHYEHEQEYINGEVFSAKQMHFIDDEYIPKSKIEEKIEELDNEEKEIRFFTQLSWQLSEIEIKRKAYKELLEENKNE